jgi:hypothetical protein
MRSIYFLFLVLASRVGAQTVGQDTTGARMPSNEAFLNEVVEQMRGGPVPAYYLVAGTDSCWFEKFDYDEWVKYHLQEVVPITVLNELAYKVHMTTRPYFWNQDCLRNAICITAAKADSLLSPRPFDSLKTVFSISQPQFTDDGQYAVIDVNTKECVRCGAGFTFIYRRAANGWRRIGYKNNWSGIQY